MASHRQQKQRSSTRKRCNSPSYSFSPSHCHKRSAIIRSATTDEVSFSSFEERDSGLDTFISSEGNEVVIVDSDDDDSGPLTFQVNNSEEIDEYLCREEEQVEDIPVSKKMERIKSSSGVKKRREPSSKENFEVKINKQKEISGYVKGESLRKVFFEKRRLKSTDFSFNNEPVSTSDDFLDACPFLDKENWPGYQRNPLIFNSHPELDCSMRSMLLEWMIQVSAACFLQRRTYYMALDFVDRVLSFTDNLPKSVLQLLGITALNIAAKVEEIFPPKIDVMADVTDGLHTVADIKAMEIHIFRVLGTSFSPVTPCDWVGLCLREAGVVGPGEDLERNGRSAPEIVRENYLPPQLYFRVMRVIDLATLDHESLRFSYRHIAIAALCLSDCDVDVCSSSGITDADINAISMCIQWMRPFAIVEHELPHRLPEPEKKHLHAVQIPHLQTFTFQEDTFAKSMKLKDSFPRSPAASSPARVLAEQNQSFASLTVNECDSAPPMTATPTGDSNGSCPSSSVFFTPPDSGSKRQITKHSSTMSSSEFNFFDV